MRILRRSSLKRLRCQTCHQQFWAARSDTKYCGRSRCRTTIRLENAKFAFPKIPRSGVEGVTFNRLRRRWMVSIKEAPSKWKYVGSFKSLKEALRFHAEVVGVGHDFEGLVNHGRLESVDSGSAANA
jgi:hypothetical protein